LKIPHIKGGHFLQIEHQLWSARQQIEGMLATAGREGATVLQELEGRVRGISDGDLVAWENWSLPPPNLPADTNKRAHMYSSILCRFFA